MESIGERLKSAREAKKLSIREVSKDTNISPIYVEALEKENFDIFPGETYLIGFLRSYSDYLKLDSETILSAYKGYKIGESTTPLEELTKPTRQNLSVHIFSLLLKYKTFFIIIILVGVFFLLFKGINLLMDSYVPTDGTSIPEKPTDNKRDNIKTIQLQNDQAIVLVYINEPSQFLVDNKEVTFLVKEIKDNSITVEVLPGNKNEEIAMDQTVVFNIPPAPREVKMTLKGLTPARAKLFLQLGASTVPETASPTVVDAPETVSNADNTSVVAMNPQNLKIVFQASFTERSFLEVYIDGVQKYRGFINPGANERWEATEFIQIKAGNAGGMKAKINGRDYSFGRSGQVVNKMVTWKKDVSNPNLYHIVVKDQ